MLIVFITPISFKIHFLIQNLFNPNKQKFNITNLPKLEISDPHLVERIENSWLGKMNMTLLCYLHIYILRNAFFFSNTLIIPEYIFKFGFLNFSSVQKSTTTRVSVSQSKVSTVMSKSMTIILVLKTCRTYFTRIPKLIPFLQKTIIKQKDFQLQRICS